MGYARRKGPRMPRRDPKKHAELVAEAGRMERAFAACGWRLVELMSAEERASALLAASAQLSRDHTPDHEQQRVLVMLMESLLPDRTPAGKRLRAAVQGAVKGSASIPGIAELVATMLGGS